MNTVPFINPISTLSIYSVITTAHAMKFNHKNQRYESGSRMIIFCFFFLLFTPLVLAQTKSDNNQVDPFFKHFSPAVAIVIAIPVSAFLLMIFFTIYSRYCAHSPTYNFDNGRRFRRMTRGLDPSVFETFPILEYSVVKIHKIGKCDLECAVCLNEFEDSETLRLIPNCDHVFHPECIDEWFESHTTCPVCRANLAPQTVLPVHGNPTLAAHPEHTEIQNDVVLTVTRQQGKERNEQANVILVNQTLNRIRTKRSRSNRKSQFPKSYSTGHSLIEPGENTERFTLKLPLDVREKIMQNPELNRTKSMVTFRRDKSDRFVKVKASSLKSPRVTNSAATPPQLPKPITVDSARLPV